MESMTAPCFVLATLIGQRRYTSLDEAFPKGEFSLYTLDAHRGWCIHSGRCKDSVQNDESRGCLLSMIRMDDSTLVSKADVKNVSALFMKRLIFSRTKSNWIHLFLNYYYYRYWTNVPNRYQGLLRQVLLIVASILLIVRVVKFKALYTTNQVDVFISFLIFSHLFPQELNISIQS